VVGLSTATWRYQRHGRLDNRELLARLQAHAAERPRYGYRRLHTLIAREGVVANHKRVHWVYREAGLQVRRRRRKRITRGERVPLAQPNGPRQRWSMDFMVDSWPMIAAFARSTSSTTSRGSASLTWVCERDNYLQQCPSCSRQPFASNIARVSDIAPDISACSCARYSRVRRNSAPTISTISVAVLREVDGEHLTPSSSQQNGHQIQLHGT
jgi:hypothetical protein